MKKICILLSITLIFAIVGVCMADVINFSDLTSEHWAYNTIVAMKRDGLINGYPDGSFKPERQVTREEFAQMIYNVKDLNGIYLKAAGVENYFDVNESRWSYNAVQMFGGYIKETSDGYVYYFPEQAISREEAAKMISDSFVLEYSKNTDTKDMLYSEMKVMDTNLIDEKYTDAVYNVYKKGFMNGLSESEFSPKSSLTRAQAATLLYRMVKGTGTVLPRETPVVTQTALPITPAPTTTSIYVPSKIDMDTEFIRIENKNKNMVYSPLSIKYALKMLSDGADGKTKEQIDSLVGIYNPAKYKSSENLSLANAFFIKETDTKLIAESYKSLLEEKYGAEIINDMFKNANNINSWISNKTLGIIKNMLDDNTVENATAILVNALAIDMKWQTSMEKPHPEIFYKEDGTQVEVDMVSDTAMINKERSYNVAEPGWYSDVYEDDSVQVFAKRLKKYDESQLEFVAIMPKKQTLSDYLKSLRITQINELRNKAKPISEVAYNSDGKTKAFIKIPKFKFNTDLNLKNDLIKLGLTDVFGANSNLSKMQNIISSEKLYVDDAKHKADIEFTEEGIKAAAVTTIIIEKSSIELIDHTYTMTFDHPFLFVIRDVDNGEVWFTGTVYSPNIAK